MRGILGKIALCALILFAAGCAPVPVAQDRTQKQANEIVAVLGAYGIPAVSTRGSGARGLYAVTVGGGDYATATSVLNDRGLLEDDRFNSLIEPRGLLPNSREIESLRADHARAVEIEELLQNHPSVASVKVVLRQSYLHGEPAQASGVSILVQVRPGMSIGQVEVIDMVLRAVPGIQRDNILVWIYTPAAHPYRFALQGVSNDNGKVIALPLVPFLFGWRVVEGDYSGLAFTLLGFVLLVGLMGGVVGYWCGAYRQSAPVQRLSLPESGQKLSRIEKATRDLPEV